MKIVIRPADLNRDRALLIQTLSSYLTPASNESRFDWLYQKNPHGPARAWLATDSNTGEVIGSSAAFARRIVVNHREKAGCVLGDFCVAEKYRSLGPALQLQRATLDAVGGSKEVELCYDFPSRQMVALYKRFGIEPAAQMVRMAKPLRLDRKVQSLVKPPSLSRAGSWVGNLMLRAWDYRLGSRRHWDIALHQGECGDEFTALRKTATITDRIEIQRSAEYLNWRYLRHPLVQHQVLTARHAGELKGYLIFNCSGENAQIEEWFTCNDALLITALVQELVRRLRKARIMTLSTWLLEADPLLPAWNRMGFWHRESCPVVVYWPQGKPASADNWFLTHGDRDL